MTDEQQRPLGRRADRTAGTGTGRRGAATRRLDLLVALGIVFPAVVALALALTRADEPGALPPQPPARTVLSDASLVCPAGSSTTAGDVVATRVPGLDGGEVDVRTAGPDAARLTEDDPVAVVPEEQARVRAEGDVVLSGAGPAAPGLVAGRTGDARAAGECRPPAYDEWFTGLGAAARQSSTIELVNPEATPAIVEVALHTRRGPVEEEDLHGIRVPGHGVVRYNLSEVAPGRGPIAAHVVVVRGRVVTTVRHTYDPLGRSRPRIDFLPSQAAPATENLVLGVPEDGSGVVHVANPGDDEARATVQVVTDDAVFTPTGLDDLVVPPGAVRSVPLARVLTDEARDGAVGLQVVSAEPVVASVRLLDDTDLGLAAPVEAFDDDEPVVAVVPAGPKRLVVGGAEAAGVVRVTAADEDGRVLLDEERLEVAAGQGATLRLPPTAVVVTVESRNTPVAATVELTGDRLGGLRLRPAEVYAEVPAVRPE